MARKSFQITVELSSEESKILDERFEALNIQQTRIDDAEEIGLSVFDGKELVGDLSGVTSFGWLYIATLWLDEAYRDQGGGSEQLQMTESEAIARDCRYACLSTSPFQAKPFYERHGYEVFG